MVDGPRELSTGGQDIERRDPLNRKGAVWWFPFNDVTGQSKADDHGSSDLRIFNSTRSDIKSQINSFFNLLLFVLNFL